MLCMQDNVCGNGSHISFSNIHTILMHPSNNDQYSSGQFDHYNLLGRQGSLVVRALDYQLEGWKASSNPRADKVHICHSAPEQAVKPTVPRPSNKGKKKSN
jgi:hypothetical protein